MGHQHPRRRDVDHRHIALARNRRQLAFAAGRACGNQRAARAGPARVQDANGDVPRHRRENRARVQHLRAEIGELGRLRERQMLHELRLGHQPWIGRQHAVDIGPDLDFVGVDAGPDDRRRIVRASAPERRRHPLARRANEAAEHRHAPIGEQRA